MKKIIVLLFILSCLLYGNVKANEFLKDGWHLLPSITDSQKKEWAYYKNGEEKLRFSKMIYVHSGWNTTPENSLASLQVLKNNGYYALTIDINFTKDNIPVLIHNDTINWAARNTDLSTINNTLYVKDLTLEQIKKYDFVVASNGNVLTNYQGNKITTFEEALIYCKNNGLTLEVEIKDGTQSQIQSMVQLAQKYNMDGVIKWTSFNPTHLSYINQYDDNEMLQLLDFDHSPTEIDQIYEKYNLKNGKNTLIYSENDGYYSVPDMPEEKNKYIMSNYALKTIPKAKIILSKNNINIQSGKTEKILYVYNGDGQIKCQSSNDNIIKCNVDQTNKQIIINATTNQVTSVTLTLWSNQGIKYSASNDEKLIINTMEILPSGILLNKNNIILNVNKTETLTASISPNNATNKSITWKSSDEDIVSVSNGEVTAKKAGEANIIASSSNGLTAVCKIIVLDNKIVVSKISLNKDKIDLDIGKQETLTVDIEPNNAIDKTITWSSDHPEIVSVNNGIINALDEGVATITARSTNSKSASCIVYVKPKNNYNNIITIIIFIILISLCIYFTIEIFKTKKK